ncbi:phage holin family protein [Micromonospora sonneratiae]|uniref:Phage holin family protein n=1 Tax=Micromonospora sonneratiae TaxID=1184706 RepID=A0ABW3YRG6_9ACTN
MADVVNRAPARPVAEQSTGELVQRAAEQISRLVRDEMALARAELVEKGRHAGLGVGLFGGGGILAFFGAGTLVAAFVLLLALVLPAWAAALVVAVALFVLAAIFALIGRRQLQRAAPLVPQAAADSVRADIAAVSSALRDQNRARST